MTRRLYYTDASLTDFTATVTSVDGVRIQLDQTAFYPTSGGQLHDLGVLAGVPVVDVIDEASRVTHVLAAPAPVSAGSVVSGRVDWPRRFDHMQQHTGQHLLSAVFDDLFKHATVSVHFGPATSTLDLDTESLTRDRANKAVHRANEIILENRPVTVAFEDAAAVVGLRKATDRSGEIRVVEIGGVDRSACGGTHVRATGEIGPVAIRRTEKHKKVTRVEFLCGWRALDRAHADFDALSAMAATMTSAIDELPALVVAQAALVRASDGERRKLADELARYRALERYNAAVPDAGGIRRIVERAGTADDIRALAQAMPSLAKVLFAGVIAAPPTIVFAASEDSGVNAGAVLKAELTARGGRGGGSPRVAQGTVADAATLDAIVSALLGG